MTFQTEPLPRPAGFREVLGAVAGTIAQVRSKPWFASFMRVLGWLWPLALVSYFVSYLVHLGWSEIWQSLPSAWLFFALIPVLYVLPAAGDLLIYRRLWAAGDRLRLSVMLHKNAINQTVVGLSGEFYLVLWARRHFPLAQKFILHSVTDSNALSTLAGWLLLSMLLVSLAASGAWAIPLVSADLLWVALLAAGVPSLIFALVLAARRIPTVLSREQLAFTFAVHMVRTALGYGLVVTLWALAMPATALSVWLNFLALRLLVSCLALMPNRELIWLSAGVGLAGFMDLPQAAIAALLMTMTAGEYVCHLVFVAVPALWKRLWCGAGRLRPAH